MKDINIILINPQNTYEKLQSMFYDELLKKSAIKLQDKAREIADKIKKVEGEKNNLAESKSKLSFL